MKGKREEPKENSRKASLRRSAPQGDPFADGGTKPPLGERWRDYWDSGKGKILVTVLSCLAVFAVVVTVALKAWIKPPSLPAAAPPEQNPPAQTVQTPKTQQPEEPDEPTDDELYPDDGYNGDMPTVSGNRKEGWYTFLLVGTDMDDGNTDTIMVVSYDTKGQKINIMSIPRDTMINEKWDIKKINSVYSRTGNSIDALAGRIQKLVGFKPDFYVKVELDMFVELVDLVEGVEFDVPQDMNYDDPYQDLHIHLKKGLQTLDGQHAMQLVRFRRYSEGDIKRVEVQQNFMKALIKECLSIKHWGKIKAYIDLAMDNIETDLDSGSIVWFAANVLGLNGVSALTMENVETCTLPGDYWGSAWSRDTHQEQSYVTIYPRQVVDLVNEKFNPYEQKVSTSMLDAMSILKNGDIASSTGSLRDTRHNAIMAVQRGEAYYDSGGNLVYGKPPAKPKQDENGNYYILDEDGNIVYTDADGNILETPPELPPEEDPDPSVQPPGEDPIASDPSAGDPNGSVSGTTTPENPVEVTEPPVNDPPADPGVPDLPEGDGSTAVPPQDTAEPSLPPEEGSGDQMPEWLIP